ncbi:MAG: cytidylate kinase-like family protein, partial [Oscillospiraceae bacterium]|nr:cytidylate kinase-like family protein [Oscillospiraceae bacterium]
FNMVNYKKENFVITISRTYGSGGREIGHKLAKKLDLPFYDKELLQMVSKEFNYSEEYLKNADEKPTNSFLYSLSVAANSNFHFNYDTMPINDQLFIAQAKLIKRLVNKSSCIIVGRCANSILADHPNILSAIIYAPLEKRIESIKEYDPNLKSENEIKNLIKKNDKQRREYHKYYANNDWMVMENYHICLDSSKIGIDGCIDVLKQSAKTKHFI